MRSGAASFFPAIILMTRPAGAVRSLAAVAERDANTSLRPAPALARPLLTGRGAGADRTVTVFAAASLSDALKEIVAEHEKTTGDIVRLNLGASSTLARQIEEGAPADLFFSADEAQMDRLARARAHPDEHAA
jgi:ABC-type molybdate transport system substrate-binding protein